MDIGQKIRELRTARGLTQQELAERLKTSHQIVSRWEKGNAEPRPAQRQKICKYFNITEADLFAEPKEQGVEYLTKKNLIPVISSIAAGDPREVIEEYPPGYAEEFIIAPVDIRDERAFSLRIEGSSMATRYLDGDYVIASPNRDPVPNRPVIAKINENEATCKLYKEVGNYIQLIPVNPEYETIVCHKKDVSWIYPVVGMYRKER